MKISAKISGAKELDAALRQLPRSLNKAVLRRAAAKALVPARDEARRLAPSDDGELAESIIIGTKVKGGRPRAETGAVIVSMGPSGKPASRAHFPEFGTVNQPMRSYMRDAWESKRDLVLSEMGAEIWKALLKTTKTLARKAAKGTLSKSAIKAFSK